MNMLILNETQQAALAALNATGHPARQLIPVPLPSGDAALPADLLTDCGPNQTWEHYQTLLQSLPQQHIDLSALIELQVT